MSYDVASLNVCLFHLRVLPHRHTGSLRADWSGFCHCCLFFGCHVGEGLWHSSWPSNTFLILCVCVCSFQVVAQWAGETQVRGYYQSGSEWPDYRDCLPVLFILLCFELSLYIYCVKITPKQEVLVWTKLNISCSWILEISSFSWWRRYRADLMITTWSNPWWGQRTDVHKIIVTLTAENRFKSARVNSSHAMLGSTCCGGLNSVMPCLSQLHYLVWKKTQGQEHTHTTIPLLCPWHPHWS